MGRHRRGSPLRAGASGTISTRPPISAHISQCAGGFAIVVETTWGQLADHVIMTPGVVTEEMVTAAVMMTGKGGKVTITAVGHPPDRDDGPA